MNDKYELLKELMLKQQKELIEFRKTLEENAENLSREDRNIINILYRNSIDSNDNLNDIETEIKKNNKIK